MSENSEEFEHLSLDLHHDSEGSFISLSESKRKLNDKQEDNNEPDENDTSELTSENGWIEPYNFYKNSSNVKLNVNNASNGMLGSRDSDNDDRNNYWWCEELHNWCMYKADCNSYDYLNMFSLYVWDGKGQWVKFNDNMKIDRTNQFAPWQNKFINEKIKDNEIIKQERGRHYEKDLSYNYSEGPLTVNRAIVLNKETKYSINDPGDFQTIRWSANRHIMSLRDFEEYDMVTRLYVNGTKIAMAIKPRKTFLNKNADFYNGNLFEGKKHPFIVLSQYNRLMNSGSFFNNHYENTNIIDTRVDENWKYQEVDLAKNYIKNRQTIKFWFGDIDSQKEKEYRNDILKVTQGDPNTKVKHGETTKTNADWMKYWYGEPKNVVLPTFFKRRNKDYDRNSPQCGQWWTFMPSATEKIFAVYFADVMGNNSLKWKSNTEDFYKKLFEVDDLDNIFKNDDVYEYRNESGDTQEIYPIYMSYLDLFFMFLDRMSNNGHEDMDDLECMWKVVANGKSTEWALYALNVTVWQSPNVFYSLANLLKTQDTSKTILDLTPLEQYQKIIDLYQSISWKDATKNTQSIKVPSIIETKTKQVVSKTTKEIEEEYFTKDEIDTYFKSEKGQIIDMADKKDTPHFQKYSPEEVFDNLNKLSALRKYDTLNIYAKNKCCVCYYTEANEVKTIEINDYKSGKITNYTKDHINKIMPLYEKTPDSNEEEYSTVTNRIESNDTVYCRLTCLYPAYYDDIVLHVKPRVYLYTPKCENYVYKFYYSDNNNHFESVGYLGCGFLDDMGNNDDNKEDKNNYGKFISSRERNIKNVLQDDENLNPLHYRHWKKFFEECVDITESESNVEFKNDKFWETIKNYTIDVGKVSISQEIYPFRSHMREGTTTGIPVINRLPTGELSLSLDLYWGGKNGLYGNSDRQGTKFINDVCKMYFENGMNKTIDNDWLKIPKHETDSNSIVGLINNTRLQAGYVFLQKDTSTENKLNVTLSTYRPIITTDVEIDNTDTAKKW